MVFADQSLVDMLRLYSILIGGTTPECKAALFEDLKRNANLIEPDSITSDSMTAYEAIIEVEKLTKTDIIGPYLDVDGYDDTTMELSKWDPLNPIDDRNQLPNGNCVTSWREIRGGNINPIVCDDTTDDADKNQILENFNNINI